MGRVRLPYFDTLKGVLIILVVVGHLIMPLANASHEALAGIYAFIYLFHMPLFIFVSGLLGAGAYRGGVFRFDLIAFYLIMCFALFIGLQLEQLALGGWYGFDFLTLNGGSISWYFMALAAFTALTPLFSRIKPAAALPATILLAAIAGFSPAAENFLTIGRIIVFLPFFLAGYYLEPAKVMGFFDSLSKRGALIPVRLAALAVLGLALAFFLSLSPDQITFAEKMCMGRSSYGNMLAASGLGISIGICCLLRVAYYLAVPLAALCVMALVPRGTVPLLTRSGAHSLQVYVLHPFVYYVLNENGVFARAFDVLPTALAAALPFLFGTAIALILGYPDFPQKAFDKLKHWCARFPVYSISRRGEGEKEQAL